MGNIGMKSMFTPCLQTARLEFPGQIDTRKARGFECAVRLRIAGEGDFSPSCWMPALH